MTTLGWILFLIAFFSTSAEHLLVKHVTCIPVNTSECQKGILVNDQSLWGCQVCAQFIEENGKCEKSNIRRQCRPGYKCISGTCQRASKTNEGRCCSTIDIGKRKSKSRKPIANSHFHRSKGKFRNIWKISFFDQLPKCLSDFERKKSNQKNKLVSEDSWLPRCNKMGMYEGKQWLGNKAICVDENGNRLFGQTEKHSSNNMTCECSRRLTRKKSEDRAWSTERREHCTSSGDFDSLQCLGDICYCSRFSGGPAVGPVVHVKRWKLLPCYDSIKHGEMYERKCEREMIRINRLKYEFFRKGVEIVGLDYVECDLDGSFSLRQCLVDSCFCVGPDGTSFKSYKRERIGNSEYLMSCRCARDEYLAEVHHAQYSKMKCDDGGNYHPLQCFHRECACVDGEGSILQRYIQNDEQTTEQKLENCEDILEQHN